MNGRQKTLFQSWWRNINSENKNPNNKLPPESSAAQGNEGNVIDLCDEDLDEDDAVLVQALKESAELCNTTVSELSTSCSSSKHTNTENGEVTPSCQHPHSSLFSKHGFVGVPVTHPSTVHNVSFKDINSALTEDSCTLHDIPDLHYFDRQAGQLWIYPTNYPVRDYQFSIVQQCLYKNTMVTLPTGLGKTFIAAVVMYNFYRWYPQGKVVFMAPTKPLVAQQMEACFRIMGIPQQDTSEMTGTMNPTERRLIWKEKRVFFLTPQVMTNDLSRGTCPAEHVKCLVIDEAHRAMGNHAYCQVVRELVKYSRHFRILALTATPGSDIKAVQQVISNLLVSHIELRTEESIDIKPYTHERKVEKIVVPLGEKLTILKNKYIKVMNLVVQRLTKQRVLCYREPSSLSKFLILKAREAFRQNPPPSLLSQQYGVVEGNFALALSLYHGYELLQLHGLHSLYNFLDGIISGAKGHGRTRTELLKFDDFQEIMDNLRSTFTQDDSSMSSSLKKIKYVSSHPKLKKLEEVVLEHFSKIEVGKGETRVMIFSQYRDSVQEIKYLLNMHQPRVKAMSFIGQSSSCKTTKGLTQKEQLKVMKEFREGGYNTLISTCVGEEGLDIGDVDLIICFDAHKSPIRLVQRMGRTGRKRQGRIVMLVTEGKEEQIYNQSQYSKRSIHKAIMNGKRSLHFYQSNPRMLPGGLTPKCHKMYITVPELDKKTPTMGRSIMNQKKPNLCGNYITTERKTAVVVEDGTLTAEEYSELQEYLVPDSQLRHPPHPMAEPLCLDFEVFSDKNSTKEEKITLSLSEWMPWQNRLQEPCFVDNSLRSRHLVELVEFLQLQNSLQDSEDHYGVEMEMFLSYEDVLQPGEEDTSTEGSAILGFGTIFKPQYLGVKEARDKTIKKKNIFDAQLTITEWKGGKGDEDNDNLPEFDVGKCMDDQFEEKENLQKEGRRNMDLKEDRKLVHSVDDKGDFEEDADSDITDDIREDIDNNTCVMEVNVGPGCLPVICTEKLTTNQDLSGNDMNICQMSVKGKSRFSRTFTLEQFEIRTSPMPDEVDDVFSEFGDMKEMPSLDIKHLVSQWYEETHGIPLKAVWLNEQHGPWVSEEITHLNAGQSVDVKAVDGACRGGSVRENHMWNDNNLLQLGVDTNTFTSVRQKTGSEDYISSDSSINIINTQKKDRLCSNRIITNGLSSETQASEIENLKAEYILDNIEEMAAATTNQEHEPISSNSPITFTQALMCVQKNEEHFPHHQQHLDKIVGSVGFNSCLNIGNIFGEIPSFNLLDDTSDFERKGQESGPFDTMNPIHCTNSDSVHCLGNTGAIPLETSDLTHIVTDEHKSFISSENPQEHTTKKTLDQVEEDFDMPYFDLEFDIEDDIIAPSPQKSQTFYQGSFSGSQHTCISHQRLECHFQQKECVIPEDSQVADMSYLHPADYVSELEITQSTTTKSHISSEWRCPHKSLDTRTGNILDFTQSTGQTSECPSSSGVTLSTSSSPTPKTSLLFNLPGSKNWSSTPKQGMSNLTQKRSDMADMARPVTSIDSSKTIAKMKSNWVSSLSSSRVAAAYPVTTDQKEELKTGSTDSEDESFQIIRKRKVIAILEDSSDSFHMQDKTGDRVSPVKTPTGYSIHQKKKAKEPSEASYGEDKHVVTKQASVEKKVFDFLDLEAVLSGSDMSCDGNYSSDEKHLDASFVNDSTQMSELDTIDMQAVYLKSIRSPVCSDHQFHLQPRHFDMDIFSQVPHEDESQYQEDSFCVTEDHKESAYSDEEGDFEELCDDSKRKKNPFKTSFQKSRKRIRHLSVSSSEEGDEAAISVPQDTQTTSQQMTTYSVSQKTQPSQVKLTIQMSNSDEERTSTQMKSKLALQGSKKGSESNRSQIPREHQISITVKTDGSHLTTSPHLQPNTSFSHKENQCQNHQTMRKEGALCTSVNNISCLSAPMMDKCGDITGVSRCKKTIITDFNHQTSKPYFSTLKKSDSGGTNSDKPLLSTRKSKERVVILVDSREISRAQGIMSTLRLKHSFTVAARQLIACDYILSSRLAVDRWNISDFSSGTNQGKLSERIQKMQGLYDRCCVIVEKDQVKPREKKSSRLSYRTKYYDWLLALLVQTSVRLFFTEDEEETAGLLVKLTELEKKKGMNISLPIDLRSDQEQIMKFFRTIPKLCYAHAISLCYNYSSISQFLSSCTPESVSVRGQMTEIRAADVCRYVCHKFDLQMTPTRK